MKVVIIGGVAGGASVATRLRRLSETMEITIFEKGSYISYANCGLPYHLSGKIANRNALLLQTPENMKNIYNVEVEVDSEVIRVNTDKKYVTVQTIEGTYDKQYDILIIATGARGRGIEFKESDKFFAKAFLKDIHDLDKIKGFMHNPKYMRALVIGSGFIGIEVAENLVQAGYQVDMVELMPMAFPLMDEEFSGYIGRYLIEKGINLYTNTKVQEYDSQNDSIILSNGTVEQYDFIVESAGLIPNSEVVKDVGVACNSRGYIIVDEKTYETSQPGIFAVGDVILAKDYLTGEDKTIPLAWGAKRGARILADYIAKEYQNIQVTSQENKGGLGTSIIKIFDLTVGFVGMTEREAKRQGIDCEVIMIHGSSHVTYYPGGTPLTIKVVYEKGTGQLLGGQIIGKEGVDKRLDVIVTAMTFGGTVYDLSKLELAYAPPYNGPKDPLNIIGYIAANIKDGLNSYVRVDELEGRLEEGAILLDVRNPNEIEEFSWEGSINIPLSQLRRRLNELEKNQEVIVVCKVAQRAYNAQRMLKNNGFKKVYNLMGGMDTIRFYKN